MPKLLRHAIFADLAPRSVIEWLLAIDVVELSWEIQRYGILRHKLLEHFREKAIEQTLRHIDLAGLPSETEDHARYQIQRNARIWRIDPTPASEIETRLAAYGYDSFAINTQVYLQACAARAGQVERIAQRIQREAAFEEPAQKYRYRQPWTTAGKLGLSHLRA